MDWNCSPSCIGSLPHTDPAKAVDFVLDKLRTIPFWPQLPCRGFRENMYNQFACFLPGTRVDEERKKLTVDLGNYDPEDIYTRIVMEDVASFVLPKESFAGFYELMSRELPPTVKALKGQVTGPISLGLQVVDQDTKSIIYDETYFEIVRKNLNLMARWQESELRKKFPQTIIFLDEPYLSLIGTPFASVPPADVIRYINETMSGLEGTKGIHCCANTDWPLVMSTDADLLSFDAYDYGHTIVLYPEEVERFLKRGGCMSWGIIPNNEEIVAKESAPSLIERLETLIQGLEGKGVDRDLILRNSILTPQCGLGGVDEGMSSKVLDLLNGVSEELRTRNSLE